MELTLDLINKSSSVKDLIFSLGYKYANGRVRKEVFRSLSSEERKALLDLKRNTIRRHCFFDERFFLEDSQDFYYFLGFFVGDGCISIRRRGQKVFSLFSTDKDVIEGYRGRIKSTHKLSVRVRKGWKDLYGLTISSSMVSDRLMSLGVPLNKSHSDGWKIEVPEKFMNSYLHGLCDSDGSVFQTGRGLNVLDFVSSSKLELERILDFVTASISPVKSNVNRMSSIWSLKIHGKAAESIFQDIYYPEIPWDMKRKRLKGESIFNIGEISD